MTRNYYLCQQDKRQNVVMERDNYKNEIAKLATSLWTPLTDEQRELLADNIALQRLASGEVLYYEDDTPEFLYYLLRGRVTMKRKVEFGHTQIVRMVEPGAIFGYVAAFENCNYKSTATAGDDTEVLKIPVKLMFHFIWENSDFAMLFLRELSSLLGLSVQRTINLTQKHIRGRLAESLVRMVEKYGVEEETQILNIYLSRDDLAKMSNMTTSNAIRTLSSFVQEGLVALAGRRLRILDEAGLRRVSQMG